MRPGRRYIRGLPADSQDSLPSHCDFCGAVAEHHLVAEGLIFAGGACCSWCLPDQGRVVRFVVLRSRSWAVWASPDELERIGGEWFVMPLLGVSVD